MQPGFEVRYLRIEWRSEGVASKVEAAPSPLAVERSTAGELTVESTIFNDSYPWLGIRVDAKSDAVPTLVDASGQETSFLRFEDPQEGGIWYISSDGWDSSGKRHLSELRRSPGVYRIRVGKEELTLQNHISSYGRADVQAYVDDFRGSLLWMIMNADAGATASGSGVSTGEQLATTLEALGTAARKVLAAPAVTVREGRRQSPVSKLRVTAETFREAARYPHARHLTSRVFDESANTAENRYIRHMLALVVGWTRAWLMAASHQVAFLDVLANQEDQRAAKNRTLTERAVDPEVFDSQTEEIARRLGALASYRDEGRHNQARRKSFPICLESRFGSEHAFFYKRIGSHDDPPAQRVAFRKVVFPAHVFELIQSTLHVCRELTITGDATSCLKSTRNEKTYRELTFSSVLSISPLNDILKKRAAQRQSLENRAWMVPLSDAEKQELKREAKTAAARAGRAVAKRDAIGSSIDALARLLGKLEWADNGLGQLGVPRSDMFPTGMIFVTNPAYAACVTAFNAAARLFKEVGFEPSLLEDLEKVGILHASDIYEKWCLLKLFTLLMEDFRFAPENKWAEKLVGLSLSGERNVAFRFRRDDVGWEVLVTYQFENAVGRRPDFVVQVFDCRDRNQDSLGGVVLDAKFRSAWTYQRPRQLLDELVLMKGYRDIEDLGTVFILQPCANTVVPAASPLEWGRHCDYGATKSHATGWIQTGLAPVGVTSSDHFKRLLVLVLQKSIPAPDRSSNDDGVWVTRSFCLGCGEAHAGESIRAKKTRGGANKWRLDCKHCGVWTDRTQCYACSTPLFKNGTQWTYHSTLADQVTHVICPTCGSYFDASFGHGEQPGREDEAKVD